MAAILNDISGDMNNPAIWPDGVVPMYPHCVTIRNGTTLTNPMGSTVELGDESAPTTPALRTEGTMGTGVFVNRGTLIHRADIQQGNVNWTMHGGSVVESANASTMLQWYVGDGATTPNAKLTLSGTGPGASRVVIRKGSGTAGLRIRPANTGGPTSQIVGQWIRFSGLGDASTPGVQVGFFTSAAQLDLQHVLYDGCGPMENYLNIRLDTLFRLRNVTFVNSLGTRSFNFAAVTSGTRTAAMLMEDCVVDKTFRFASCHGLAARRCVLCGGTDTTGEAVAWDDMVMYDTTGGGGGPTIIPGSCTRGIRVRSAPASTNWHGVQINLIGTFVVDGLLFDGATASDNGDLIMTGTQGSATIVRVRNVMTTHSGSAEGSYGKLTSQLGNANITFEVENCTHFSTDKVEGGTLGFGETYAGRADMIAKAQNMLTVGASAGKGVLFLRQGTGATNNIRDAVTPANISNNCVFNCRAGGAGVGPASNTASGGDGVMWNTLPPAPIDVDPMFVDSTRNLATWYRSLVGGTPDTRGNDTTAAINALRTLNDDSPMPGATIRAAYAWIVAGRAPRNPRLRTGVSSENNGWIGAVPGNNNARLLAHGMI